MKMQNLMVEKNSEQRPLLPLLGRRRVNKSDELAQAALHGIPEFMVRLVGWRRLKFGMTETMLRYRRD